MVETALQTDRALQTINAVCKNKDIGILYAGGSVDELLEAGYGEAWRDLKEYHAQYHAIPDIEVLQEKHKIDKVDVPAKTEYYLEELRNEHVSTRMDNVMTKAAMAMTDGNAPSAVLAKLQESLANLNRFTSGAKDLNLMDFDEAERHYEDVRKRAEALGGQPGIPTGVSFIDSAYTSGFAPGDLIVMLGWTGRAKSLVSTLFACNAHDKDFTPMVVSLEMTGSKVRDRVYTIKGSGMFANSKLGLGDIGIDSFRQFRSLQENKSDFIVVTNEGSSELTPNVVEAKIDQHKPSLVVIDYAQLASDNANSDNMTVRMMNMSKEYKRLAVKKGVAIILISSATADASTGTKEPPRVEQVAWSKQLSYDADLSLTVHKLDESDLILILCTKNRNGPEFAGYIDWDIDNGIIKEVFDN